MTIIATLLASGVLYGAFIGMMIAAILVAVIPSWRKAVIESHKKGSEAGERFGNKVAGRAGDETQASAQPIERYSACPNCGSKKFKAAESKVPWADSGFFSLYMVNDRSCKECGTVYHMCFPTWARWLFMIMGLPVVIFGFVFFFAEGEVLTPIMCVLIGTFIFAMGFCLPKQ